ncbi:hypothetical protein KI387_044138 [Taxus chinensis]|uniref:Uncharacterized protein n=1 Tax=Taxus chinensis TaxID=29808 RepID=A0AA38F3F6_TAXCH|nr:hypothetical protein KI387_044138 [Taxus chinensis]
MNHQHRKDKGAAMVSIKKVDTQWMPRVTRDAGLEPILVTTRAEAARTKEIPRQKIPVSREEVVHGKYPDPAHQKEVYQDTMDVIWSLQGEIQCLKEQSRREEQRRKVEVPKDDLDKVKEREGTTRRRSAREACLACKPSPHSLDYDKEITLDAVIDGWLLSNILIDTGAKVNVLTFGCMAWMGRPALQPSSNVLYMANKTKAFPIGVLKDATITIQGAKFSGDFEVLALAEADNFPALLGRPWCYKNNVDLRFNKGYISFENKEERVIIPLADGKSTPYTEPLGEEVLDRIYVRSIRDLEIIHPTDGVIQFEDA